MHPCVGRTQWKLRERAEPPEPAGGPTGRASFGPAARNRRRGSGQLFALFLSLRRGKPRNDAAPHRGSQSRERVIGATGDVATSGLIRDLEDRRNEQRASRGRRMIDNDSRMDSNDVSGPLDGAITGRPTPPSFLPRARAAKGRGRRRGEPSGTRSQSTQRG